MLHLTKSLQAWGGNDFKATLKTELESVNPELLPLQQCLSNSSHVSDSDFSVMILGVEETIDTIYIKAGIFYTGIIAGCNCADDPSPIDEQNEYCELIVTIDKRTATSEFTIADG